MINLNSIHKSFGRKEVLRDINCSFHRGEIKGVVGENGAGKTTLFCCLAGLESYKGHIELEAGLKNSSIGYLPTTPYMLSKITGYEYLQLICRFRKIDNVDFDDKNIFDLPLQEYADLYSTGMRKKLALTGLLLQQNEVYLLDEPFNGLDLQSNLLLKDILLKLKSLNKYVIISSHIFSTLSEICDQILYLDDGNIVSTVQKNEFPQLEERMRNDSIRSRIDLLDLE